MLDNTATPVKELGEKVKEIASGSLDTDININAHGDIAELIKSFNNMTEQLKIFERKNKETSPLTGLPGGISIEEEMKKRIKNKQDFATCMIDADNFKPFNDFYGYSKGNVIIKYIATLIKEAVYKHGSENDFIGHIGGDDFIIICESTNYHNICKYIINEFNKNILTYYDAVDSEIGYIESKDRSGKVKQYKVMSLTIAVVNSNKEKAHQFFEIGEELAKLKGEGKKINGSIIVTNE